MKVQNKEKEIFDAIQNTPENLIEIITFLRNFFVSAPLNGKIQFKGQYGLETLNLNNYFLKNKKGDIFICIKDDFNNLYTKIP